MAKSMNPRVACGQIALASCLATLALLAGCAKTSVPLPPPAQAVSAVPAELNALMDRAAIEDLFADYYSHIGVGTYDFSVHFIEDGVLDVNGLVAKGAEQIQALYVRAAGGASAPPPRPDAVPPGRFQMVLSNLRVTLNGDNATASAFWTSLEAETVIASPEVTEYGREQTQLVKHDGRWLISHRVVTSDGGMPRGELKSYVKR